MTPMTEMMLRSWYGDAAAKATMARNIIAPVAGQLSGHPSELHRHCILVRTGYTETEDVCESFWTYGPIEAITVSGGLGMAVVVFRTTAAATLGSTSECCEPVPPLYLGPPLVLADAGNVKVALHPKKPAPREKDVPIMSFFRALDGDETGRPLESITVFVPSPASLKNGPRLGLDGHLRYDGTSYTYWRSDTGEHFRVTETSRRATDLDEDPHEKRYDGHTYRMIQHMMCQL